MGLEHIIYYILLGLFIVLSMLFSGTETSLISANSIKLQSLSEQGKRRAKKSLLMIENMEESLGMILIGNNIANIAATSFIVFLATKAFMLKENGILAVTLVQTFFFLVFCEILPKTIARSKADSFLMFFSYPMHFISLILKPLIRLSLLFSNKLKRVFRYNESSSFLIGSRDEIGTLFKLGHEEGIIDEDYHQLVSEILSFHKVSAGEIATPTIDIVSIETKQNIRFLVKLIETTRFSRIPVYEDRVDNIIGYVHYRDLLRNRSIRNIDEIIKKPHFVPSSKGIYDLFLEMQEKNTPMVFVVNEFGAVEGLISYEDIVEEIVGEIQTRDHPDEILIQKINNKKYILDGGLNIDHFEKIFGLTLVKKRFSTIAGFVTYKLARIPKKGDTITVENHIFTVQDATDRSVEKVLFEIPQKIRKKK